MTERLYYKDPGLLEFTARVVETGRDEHGCVTVLDRSAFYPTSGGQSYDTGSLNGKQVVDVTEGDAGRVLHHTTEPVGAIGDAVEGRIDKVRRRRHRQSHTGQHLLSAAFHHLFGYVTASVHLGEEYSAVEFDVETVSDNDLKRAETWVNDTIADNVPIEIMFVESDRIAELPMRKQPKRSGLLRLIKIGELDYSACGGTHCNTTGGVGLLKIVGIEKMRGRALVKYLCGDLAVADYLSRYEATDVMARAATCNPDDLPGKFEKLSDELRDAKADLSALRKELLPTHAAQLATKAEQAGRCRFVLAPAPEADPSTGGQLAALVADNIGGLAVLLIAGRLMVAAPENGEFDAGQIVKALVARCDLKGGGNRRQAQLGGAPINDLAPYRAMLREILGDA